MRETIPVATPASLLQRAQQALWEIEREENEEREKLTTLRRQEGQLFLELRRGPTTTAIVPDAVPAARTRLDDLSRKHEEFARRKAQHSTVMRGVRERLYAARRAYEELERHALELQHTIRREERLVAQWQRQVKHAEEELSRWRRILTEAEARLEQAQWELCELTGFGTGRATIRRR